MSYKLEILKNLTLETYTSYSELISKCKPKKLDKFSLDLDELGADKFIVGFRKNNELYFKLRLFSSVRRFKRFRRNNVIKITSFAISVIMLIIAAVSLLLQSFL